MAFEDAVVVDSIAEERQYIAAHPCTCGGAYRTLQQALFFDPDKKPYDQIKVECEKCHAGAEFWFDCSRFFGKPAW